MTRQLIPNIEYAQMYVVSNRESLMNWVGGGDQY